MSPILQLIVLILSFIATDLWNIGTASGAVVAEDLCTDPKPLSDSNATRLLNQLLDNYDNRQRPNITGLTVIMADLNIRSMGPISEVDMSYSMDAYFRQTWVDERLRFSGDTEMAIHIKMLQKIWKPDTYFLNGKDSYLHEITEPNKLLRINPNGTILYSMRLTIKASCPMYLHNFPVDEQSCPLQFGSYAYNEEQVRYVWKFDGNSSIKTAEGMRLSQFDLIGTTAWHQVEHLPYGKYSTLKVTFRLRRHMGYFLIQVYFPCMLIVVLSWVSFWLNREATADRVGLGITTVLTLTTTSMDTRDDLPKVHYATALDLFVNMCFGFVIGSLLQFAAVHYFTKIGSGDFEDSTAEKSELDSGGEGLLRQTAAGDDGDIEIGVDRKCIDDNDSDNDDDKWADEGDWMTEDGRQVDPPLFNLPGSKRHKQINRRHIPANAAVGAPRLVQQQQQQPVPSPTSDGCECSVIVKDKFSSPTGRRSDWWLMRLLHCLKSDAGYRQLIRRAASPTGVNSVSMIDRISRVLFPTAFLCLNCIYWVGYTRHNS